MTVPSIAMATWRNLYRAVQEESDTGVRWTPVAA
jgi:hypothetical protein